MKGDFSRFTFDSDRHYTGVLMQQGRVQLDADWNEQVEINNYQRQMQAHDVIGFCGMPSEAPGFEIIIRQGLRFNGKDQFVYGGKETDLSFVQNKGFTIESWVNPQHEGHGGVIAGRFAMFRDINLPEYVLFINPDHTVSFFWVEVLAEEYYESIDILESEIAFIYKEVNIEKIALRFRELRTIKKVSLGKFSHIAVTLYEDEISIFIDGIWAGKTGCGRFQASREGMFFIGTGWYNKRLYHVFHGVIDRVAIWNAGLSPERIKENVYTFLTGDEPGLLRLWRFNQEDADNMNIRDWSPHNKPCILGAGRNENAPGWEPPFTWIGKGRCYLNGVLCENNHDITFAHQPYAPGVVVPQVLHPRGVVLFYLEVWQRHITAMQNPRIRETALGGPDTATRMQTVWQVKYILQEEAREFFSHMTGKGLVKVRRQQTKTIHENRLYRIEIHCGGGLPNAPFSHAFYPVLTIDEMSSEKNEVTVKRWHGAQEFWECGQYVEIYGVGKNRIPIRTTAMITAANYLKKKLTLNRISRELTGAIGLRIRRIATFKWSKENGTLVFSIAHSEGNTLVLKDPLGMASSLSIGQRIEVLDDQYVLQGRSVPLVRIEKIQQTPDGDVALVLNREPYYKVGAGGHSHPLVRVWDQTGDDVDTGGGVIPIRGNHWFDLEEGLQVYFAGSGEYHSGDYWWVPARSSTQEIQWPEENQQPVAQPPHGIRHDFAPLGIVDIQPDTMRVIEDRRRIFKPLIHHL